MAYLMLVERLGICLRELRTLEKISPMDEARFSLPFKNMRGKRWRRKWLKRPFIFITFKPATKDWSTILGNSRSLPRMWSKPLLLLRRYCQGASLDSSQRAEACCCQSKAGRAGSCQKAGPRKSYCPFFQVGVSSSTASYEEILIRGRIAGSSFGRS